MRDQRVVGAIAGVGLGRQLHLQAELLGGLAYVLCVIQAGRIEGRRNDRQQQLHLRQIETCVAVRSQLSNGEPRTGMISSPSTTP